MKKHNRTSLTESIPNHRENISLYETRIYATKINKLTGTHTHFNLRDASSAILLRVSMERFSFQRMGKGMQPSRCLAILGETLRPIPASRVYGGSV